VRVRLVGDFPRRLDPFFETTHNSFLEAAQRFEAKPPRLNAPDRSNQDWEPTIDSINKWLADVAADRDGSSQPILTNCYWAPSCSATSWKNSRKPRVRTPLIERF
jgi:hypothetical protein